MKEWNINTVLIVSVNIHNSQPLLQNVPDTKFSQLCYIIFTDFAKGFDIYRLFTPLHFYPLIHWKNSRLIMEDFNFLVCNKVEKRCPNVVNSLKGKNVPKKLFSTD